MADTPRIGAPGDPWYDEQKAAHADTREQIAAGIAANEAQRSAAPDRVRAVREALLTGIEAGPALAALDAIEAELGRLTTMLPMADPALDPIKAAGTPVLLLYPADIFPSGKPMPAAWLIDRWSEHGKAIGEPGWQHRSARWADPVGWIPLPAIPPARR